MFFHESLKLLPHLANLRLILLPLDALRGRPLLGLGQRLLKGCHLRRGPYNSHVSPVTFCNCTFLYLRRYFLPSLSSSCFLARPSSSSYRSRFCFSVSTSTVSATDASSEACIRILTYFC